MTKCVWPVKPEDRLCKYCKITWCKDRDYSSSRKYGTVTPTMRDLEVGNKAVFGSEKYGAVRIAKARLAPKRFTMFLQGENIVVERIL